METKILQIFYGADNLPYKDKARQVHFPVSGQSFSGASLTTEIRFYTKEIGGVDSITWVANAKRPDGKIAYQQLESNYDSEVEESYVALQLSQWFTEKKGDLFIALNGYAGGVDIEVDEDSGLYTVSGTPIIQATGSIKIIIAYAPIMNNGYGAVPEITVQQALGAVANKLDKQNAPSTVYGVNADSEQVMLPYSLQATPSTLARRDLAGQINVPLTPTDNANATSKGYVDSFGKSIELTMDSDYKLYLTLKDANGNVLGTTQVVDLPLESVVVGGSYDSVNKALVLILENGNTISIPVGDLIDGLVSEEQLETALEEKQDTLVSGENIKTLNGTTLLGNGNYAFDIAFDENSTNALENRVISKEVREINYELAIIREELFEVVLTELDYTEDFATLYAIPDSISDDDGTHRVVYSETELKRIDGNTIVDNQLLRARNSTTTVNGITYEYSNDGSIKISGTATGYSYIYFGVSASDYVDYYANHKYFFNFNVSGTISGQTYNILATNVSSKGIITKTSSGRERNYISFSSGSTVDCVIKPIIVDITQMFPINTPTTLDDVRVQWLLSRGYISYNTGSLLTGTYSGLYVRKNILPTLPLKAISSYTFTGNETFAGGGNDGIFIFSQLSNVKATLSSNDVGNVFFDGLQPSSANGCYSGDLKIAITTNGAFYLLNKTYVNNMSGFKSWITGKTVYFELATPNAQPLQSVIDELVISTISIPTTELKSAGSVHDYIEVVEGNVVEGEQLYNLVKHTLVESVDLGSLSYTHSTNNSREYFVFQLPLIKPSASNTDLINALCHLYTPARYVDTWKNKDISYYYGSNSTNVVIINNSYTDAATFKTAMSGVPLYYELATPTQETIATNLHFDEISSLIEQGGSIESIYTNVPPNITTTFVVKKAVGE